MLGWVPLIVRLFNMLFAKRAAESTADYLNQRRARRLADGQPELDGGLSGIETQLTETPVSLPSSAQKSSQVARPGTTAIGARWYLLSGTIIGAILTIILLMIWFKGHNDDE